MENAQLLSLLRAEAPGAAAQARAIGAPLCYGTRTRWYSDPAACFEAMLADLRRAERSVWLAAPAIVPGVMWETILTVLRQKAAEGADVRLVYDGRRSRLPRRFSEQLALMRIRSRVLRGGRPHRALILDGTAGYTGSLDICDGQIGLRCRREKTRVAMLRLQGAAAERMCERFSASFPDAQAAPAAREAREYGYVSFFSDMPGAVLHLIGRAERSVCLMAPRLTPPLRSALRLAAASGVEVRAVVGQTPLRRLPDVPVLRFPGRVRGCVCCADGRTAAVVAGREGVWLHGHGVPEIEADLRSIPGLTACGDGHTPEKRGGFPHGQGHFQTGDRGAAAGREAL